MGGSRLQEWTPKHKYAVVEWQRTYRMRKVVGKWVERPIISRSVPATPTKSPSKQESYGMLYHGGDDFSDDLGDHMVTPLHLPKSLSQNDYIHQWVPKTKAYLDILLEREVPSDRSCIICGTDGVYKCHGCFGEPLFCTSCCRTQHQRLPFHRVSQWTGSFFEESCLVKSGMVIWLGHGGNACPWDDDVGESALFTTGEGDSDDTDAKSILNEPNAEQSTKEAHDLPTGMLFIKNNKAMTTIVDKSGVHTHIVKYCTCPEADTADIQLFNMGLFPASFIEPKTAFTFDVLDDFLLDNLECGTSAMNYYSKLRRMTTSVFPHLVPDRYQELMRVARQWRKLKLLKWNGFGHEDKEVRPGDLALFCPACPQPGINTPSCLYTRSLVMNRNFKAEHLHATNPADEVSLMDSRGFMEHLAIAKDAVQCSECNNHHMVNLANASRHRLEATGIGGCACARHGCFVPHAMVDFQKGERQMNMDYALCEALKLNAKGIRRVLTFYDVNCQYHKHLQDHIADSPLLKMHPELEITPGIGLWHVHGHQDSCYVRYASNFIQGAARIDGEIMETLWVPLNIISPVARGMGTPHRKECLDYQMNDCNFMKMIRMSKSLCRKYKEAMKGVADSNMAFERLDETANANKVKDWEAQERLAHERQHHDPTAMDIYEVQLCKAPTRKQQGLRLLTAQGRRPGEGRRRGAATWLAEGLAIEEAQVTLQMDVRKLGHWATDTQRLAIGRRRDTLQRDIDRWTAAGAIILGKELGNNDMQIMQPDLLILQEDTEEDMDAELRAFEPEKGVIPLPSNLGLEKCVALGIADIADQELTLWQGQANNALHHIRVHLADKAVIFLKTVRVAKSQALSTRAWAQVHSVDRAVSINASIYSKCRSQLCRLGADDALLKRYQPLTREHLKRNNVLAWFCDWLNEFYRVHWLRAKAMRDQWAEELLLVQHEMDWTCNFLLQKADEWIRLSAILKLAQKHGHVAYSERQCKIYQHLFGEARDSFNQAKAAWPPV
ncbi:uncharacterized protein F5147DRAFT_745887 [Suillus discolor]|uniref:CxC2-like cysteine cluster KDZ transposase-associated domain-containing protein n=1 Tax=Suillus discolor TaxID=1912936 RepID=A0A9P7F7Z2_9AGAM|nr:uncharacterized protein F5147DRAFT_745887 [Suillus discolor]KAG2108071.1 hypothetical protein F5147DRAFT_745887 [Suillus discolor]